MTLPEIRNTLLRVKGQMLDFDNSGRRVIKRALYKQCNKEDSIIIYFEIGSPVYMSISAFNNTFNHLFDSNYPPITKLKTEKPKQKPMIKNKEVNSNTPAFLKENELRKEIKSSRLNPPYIRVAKDKGEFIFSKEAVNLLSEKKEYNLMFSLDRVNNKVYFYEQKKDKSTYNLTERITNGVYSFTNMNLKTKVKEALKIKTDQTLYFDVKERFRSGFKHFEIILNLDKTKD